MTYEQLREGRERSALRRLDAYLARIAAYKKQWGIPVDRTVHLDAWAHAQRETT